MTDKLTVAILGAGRIGQLHANNLINMPNVIVKTVYDPFPNNKGTKEWFETTQIENFVTDENEIFNDDEIDAVFICSPTDTHLRFIEAGVKSNKHVFCEKPISFDPEETKRVHEIVKSSDKKVQIGFNRRFDASFSKVQKNIADKVGSPHVIKITSRDPEPPELKYVEASGGLYFDMTIHDFDMVRFLANSEVTEIHAYGHALINKEIEQYDDIDTSVVTMKFENGAIGVIDNSRQASYGYDQRIEVFGPKGQLLADNQTDTTVKHYSKESVSGDKPVFFFLERYNDAFITETELFVEAVLNNLDVYPSYEDGMKAQELAFAAKKSLKEGKAVELDN